MTSTSRHDEADLDADLARPGRHRAGYGPGSDIFTQAVLDYAALQPGRAVTVVQAGCATAGADLDFSALRASHCVVDLTMLDEDTELTRAAVASRPDLAGAVLGELRAAAIAPRSVDVVHCCLLLDRIRNAELVLGRLAAAIRPGGLLLLSSADRDTAAGFLDRRLPAPLRRLAWNSLRPGEPGPHPASYEQLASARGVQLFTSRHGLVIVRRELCSRLDRGRRQPVVRATRWLVAAGTRGRLSAAHDELRFVIRRPEDQFARVL